MAEYQLAEFFEFPFQTRRPSGALVDADALPTYRVYAEGSDTVVATGNCAKRDDANTTGYYVAQAQLTSPEYVEGTIYYVRVAGIIDGITTAAVVGTLLVVPADVLREDDTVTLADGGITAAKVATGAIDADALAADVDTYQARIELIDDDNGTTDRYIVVWFKNSQPVTTGITVPTIQVVKCADGTNLVAEAALTQVPALGLWHKAETTNRVVSGVAYIAKVTATIDAASRTWYEPIGRDT